MEHFFDVCFQAGVGKVDRASILPAKTMVRTATVGGEVNLNQIGEPESFGVVVHDHGLRVSAVRLFGGDIPLFHFRYAV